MSGSDALPIALGLLAVAVCAAFALLPLVRQSTAPRAIVETVAPAERFDIYRQVVDLEFDRQTGKLSAEDLELLRADLLARATALAREQQRDDRDIAEQVEHEIAAARAALHGQPPTVGAADRTLNSPLVLSPSKDENAREGLPTAPARGSTGSP